MISLINLLIILIYLFYYSTSLVKGQFQAAILIGMFFPSIANSINLESFVLFTYLILILLPVLVKLIDRKSLKFRLEQYPKLALLSITFFYLWMLISIVYSPVTGGYYFYEKLIFYFANIFLPVLLIVVTNVKLEWKYFIKCLIIVTFLSALIPIYNVYEEGLFNILNKVWFARLAINDSNPIWFGRFLSFGFIAVLIFIDKIKYKLVMLLSILIAIFFTGSKAVLYFSLFVFTLYIIFILIRNKEIKGAKFKLFAPAIVLLISILFLLTSLNEQSFERRFSASSGTIDVRSEAIEKLIDQDSIYLLGNGLASSGYAITNSYQRMYPHNITIEVYFEFGIIGVLIYFVPYLLVLIKFVKRFKSGLTFDAEDLFILCIVLLSFLYSQTSGDLFSNQYGIIFSFIYLLKNDKK